MKEEDYIKQFKPHENPFRTPEGYFEGFTGRLMQRIQDKGLQPQILQTKRVQMPLWKRWVRYSAAAVVAGVCMVTGSYLYVNRQSSQLYATSAQAIDAFSDEQLDEALNYEIVCGLVDNNQIEYYLTEAY
ncbi:MAG: hypothetical protein IJ209_04855 [Bacteroidaceae bacterium]|nr:hypothetical protein [Bacteroidaceae bacterium]